ncbi:MAG: phosphoribosyl-ATP diphosphatase [Clostridium sp.]
MKSVLEELYNTILERKKGGDEGSYTSYLFLKGKEKILKKVGEECSEVVIASMKGDNKDEQVSEICDLVYHLMVLMGELDITMDDISEELTKRSNKINNFKGERKEIDNV